MVLKMTFPLTNRSLMTLTVMPAIGAFLYRGFQYLSMAGGMIVVDKMNRGARSSSNAASHVASYDKIKDAELNFDAFKSCFADYRFTDERLRSIYYQADTEQDVELRKEFFYMQLNQNKLLPGQARGKTDAIYNKIAGNNLDGIADLLREFEANQEVAQKLYNDSRIAVLGRRVINARAEELRANQSLAIKVAHYNFDLSKFAFAPAVLSTAACVFVEMSDRTKLVVAGVGAAASLAMNYFMAKDTSTRERA